MGHLLTGVLLLLAQEHHCDTESWTKFCRNVINPSGYTQAHKTNHIDPSRLCPRLCRVFPDGHVACGCAAGF